MHQKARIRRGKYLLNGVDADDFDRPDIIIGQPIIIYKKPEAQKPIKMSMHKLTKRKFHRKSRSFVSTNAFDDKDDMTLLPKLNLQNDQIMNS